MDYAPIARIVVRYIVGLVVGSDTAGIIAADPDVITIVAIGIGVAVEGIYTLAKKREWKL
jgi:hypothetical protein